MKYVGFFSILPYRRLAIIMSDRNFFLFFFTKYLLETVFRGADGGSLNAWVILPPYF